MSVQENAANIREQISKACTRSGRDPENIHIIAVTKYVSEQTAQEAVEAGISDIGENRDEGLLKKHKTLGALPSWHFIGTLQSRKVKKIINQVDYIHSLDRLSLAKEIDKRANRKIKCFVQVNTSGEASKHGLSPEDALAFIEQLKPFSSIEVVGLMTMAPYTEDERQLRSIFRATKALQQSIQKKKWQHAPCTELSMGMSNDYQIAVEEGATFVRIGTALVGKEF